MSAATAAASAAQTTAPKAASQPAQPKRPNVIFILADDLGYGDLGCFGQKLIETPNIDALSNSGIRFTQHYAGAPVSSPSRCSLQTGLHGGHAPIRDNDEMGERGDVWSFQAMLDNPYLEGQRPMPADTRTIGQMFIDAGYNTAMVGKWGLGYPGSVADPNKMGYELFYGFNCQRQPHVYYPMFLWHNDKREYLDNAPMLTPNDKLDPGADPMDPASYEKFKRKDYAPDKMFDRIVKYIDDQDGTRPFLLMWTTTIPHASLQAPQRWVDHYVKKLGDEQPSLGGAYVPCRYPRATYAAMISYLDDQIGQVVAQLKRKGIYDNTIIVFTSDNGPTGKDYAYFNSTGIFNGGGGWGKGSVHEGGIRVPMIFTWPAQIKNYRESGLISAFYDFMPTFAQIAGGNAGRTDGISFVDELMGRPQKKHDFLYWEYHAGKGQQACRMGKWKLDVTEAYTPTPVVNLYNLETDPREQYDLKDKYPAIVKQMQDIMVREHTDQPKEMFKPKP